MDRKPPAVVLVAVVVAVLLLATTGVQATAVRSSFTATATRTFVGAPQKMWVDDEGILHIRGRLIIYQVTGDVAGTNEVMQNLNIDLATGDGDGYGTASQHFTWNGLTGTFEGRWSATITGGNAVVQGVGQGTAGLDGLTISYTSQSTTSPGELYTEGTILAPLG